MFWGLKGFCKYHFKLYASILENISWQPPGSLRAAFGQPLGNIYQSGIAILTKREKILSKMPPSKEFVNKVKFSGWKYGERCLSSQGNRTIIMQMPFEIQLDLAAVVESPRTYYTEPSEPEGWWTMFFPSFCHMAKQKCPIIAPHPTRFTDHPMSLPTCTKKEYEGSWRGMTQIQTHKFHQVHGQRVSKRTGRA